MKVILKENIRGVGKRGDIKELSDGYIRNALLPKGLVEEATPQRVELHLKEQAQALASKEARLATTKDKAKAIGGALLEFHLRTDQHGITFGSVNSEMIIEELKRKNLIENQDKITIELEHSIKKIGDHTVVVDFKNDVQTNLRILVRSQQ